MFDMFNNYDHYYVLIDGKVYPAREHFPDMLEWALWNNDINNRLIELTNISESIDVSTVFLGINHNFTGDGAPILFETIVFVNGDNKRQLRYTTLEDARAGHAAMVHAYRSMRHTPERRKRRKRSGTAEEPPPE